MKKDLTLKEVIAQGKPGQTWIGSNWKIDIDSEGFSIRSVRGKRRLDEKLFICSEGKYQLQPSPVDIHKVMTHIGPIKICYPGITHRFHKNANSPNEKIRDYLSEWGREGTLSIVGWMYLFSHLFTSKEVNQIMEEGEFYIYGEA